jgi:hypothetical protein
MPAARPRAARIRVERGVPVGAALAGLAEREQEFRAARREPRLRAFDHVDRVEQLVERQLVRPGVERRAARVQREIRIDVGTLLERTRRRRERHAFVLEHAEIGEHELGPVLMKIAEEHQPQPFAQRADRHPQHAIVGLGAPCFERLRDVAVSRTQAFEPFRLALARMRTERRKHLQQIGARRQREQRIERQRGRRIDPAERGERRGRVERAADLVIRELARAEVRAVAHQHPHEQCARCLRQPRELGDERALGGVEQVVVALAEPRERTFEVGQVVKRRRRRRCRRHGIDHCTFVQVGIISP